MLRTLCCCYCCRPSGPRHSRLVTDESIEDDYVLPGGNLEWDKSTKRFISKQPTIGSYVPPLIPTESISNSSPRRIEEFKLLKTVGKGAFGKVLLAVHKSTKTLYAIKVVPKTKITRQKQIQQIVTEMQILKKVRHPFCVALQYSFQNGDNLFYVFEFAAGGMLFYHLREEGRFSEPKSRFYIGEIILALEYLHSLGIIFRDLKPENCMLSAIGHIVITDFGSAKKLSDGEKTSTLAGTPQYMAPEVLRGEPYSYSADWWCCGILLYEMLVGKTPFQSHNRVDLYRAVLRGDFRIPFFVSPRARSLLYRLIERNPDLRIGCVDSASSIQSAEEIKNHPFFSTIPADPEEESQYLTEEAERLRHQEALDRASSTNMAGNIVRRLSYSAARFRNSVANQNSIPCEWEWDQLLECEVAPPFTPQLTHPTDCYYFDPVMTSLAPTLEDMTLSGSGQYIDGFDYNPTVNENFQLTESMC